jgi:hypothetical protein
MVEHYALQVNQKKLAAAAILKWEALHKRERGKQTRSSRKRTSPNAGTAPASLPESPPA